MSLINEALKKAQRQRSLDNAPLSSAPSGVAAAAVSTHVRTASHKSSQGVLWFGIGLVALGAGVTVVVMRYGFDSSEPAKVASAAPAISTSAPAPVVTPVQPPAPAATAPEQATPAPVAQPAAEPAPMIVLPPIAQAPAPAPAPTSVSVPPPAAPTPVVAAPVNAPSAETTTATAPTTPTPVAPILTPAERETQVYSFLNTVRLAGVRGVDREARVLMNERVWRLNDVVSPELGLRLSAVRPNLLVFTDAQGRTYEKHY